MPIAIDEETIRKALREVRLSDGRDVVSAGLVQAISIDRGVVNVVLETDAKTAQALESVRLACEAGLRGLPGVEKAMVILTAEASPSAPQNTGRSARLNTAMARETAPQPAAKQPLPGVTHVIAVASGKGGVGKSTVAVNLALGLQRLGLSVGLLDADIYGPSVPRLLGLKGKPKSKDGKRLEPLSAFGIKAISVGNLIDPDQPMIWRGPVATAALSQLLTDVTWAPLDVLVVDMPPGTGDIQLTMAQKVPLSGAVMVSTPQDIALIDVRRGLAMFRRVAVPVIGVVENMSTFICPNCSHESHIFGHGGARKLAKELETEFLGEIPLTLAIRETSDAGQPVVATAPHAPDAMAFMAVAEKVLAFLNKFEARPAPLIRILP
jgi:ATP-binding protein involved in chromosome partitioning